MLRETSLEPLTYNDVLLLPQHSDIGSRDEVNLYTNLNKDAKEYIPIFSSPMKNISEPDLVIRLSELGGIGILHRFFDYSEQRYEHVEKIGATNLPFGISIGLRDIECGKDLNYVSWASENFPVEFVVIDTASGYISKNINAVKILANLRKEGKYNFKIIAGNVVDYLGCDKLSEAGADFIRLGIGTGMQCLTSKSIGIGCPMLTTILDCVKNKEKYPHVKLLADGGIYSPGDALKAFCFGADGVIIGSLFGRAEEADNNGVIFGMSSYKLQNAMNKTKKSNEGTVTIIPKEEIRSLDEIWNEFTYGLKSGLSYLGCNDINVLHNLDIEYIKIRS